MADRCGPVPVQAAELERLVERVRARALEETDYPLIEALVQTLSIVREALEQKKLSIKRLRLMLFGSSTERTSIVTATEKAALRRPEGKSKRAPRGHGRRPAQSYWGARRIEVVHEQLHVGDVCPDCHKGKLYDLGKPALLLSFSGAAPVQAELNACQRLRCGSCGIVFTAEAPEKVRAGKHDPSAGSMIALLRYGSGFPFHRLQRLQQALGIPLAASVQWKLVQRKAKLLLPVYERLTQEAAQGEVIHVDDTTVKILTGVQVRTLPDEPEAQDEEPSEGTRKGSFTTGMVCRTARATIVLYRSGSRYAGENLKELLARRDPNAGTPIQISDGLNRNRAGDLPVIRASCNAHSRRRFVELIDAFPQECRGVLEAFKRVYRAEAQCVARALDPQQRLRHHQRHSAPAMAKLRAWGADQLEGKHVEPNSSLGQAINYMLKRWEQLTLFLRVPGAPVDNNVVERALKRAILHRKNSLFYQTLNGAAAGDLYMSLIATCIQNKADPFDYLNVTEIHAAEIARDPGAWMPWNYRDALRMATAPPAASSA
jgi:transposase